MEDFANNERKKAIDPTSMNWCEMALLRKRDPFMYYSIPGNRDKELPGNEIDLSELDLSTSSGPSRSFSAGAPKKNPPVESHRRHSEPDSDSFKVKRRGSGVNFEFAVKCPSIEEDAKIDKRTKNHSRCKSSNEIIQSIPCPASHRRTSTCSDIDQTKLVERKSVISYESHVDTVLESVIEEQAALLQPNAPRRTYGDSNEVDELRRGSILEDILFESIAQLGNLDLADFDSDTESETESDETM